MSNRTSDLKPLGKTGEKIPSIGLGTFGIGGFMERDDSRDEEGIRAIKKAIELGMWLIDTAEIYGEGHSEELVGEAIKQFKRDEVFIVTKVWYTNLRFDDVMKAIRGSLRRLGVKYVDLYLVHAPNPAIPFSETAKAMERLVDEGLARYIGVSNFTASEMEKFRNCLSKYDIVVNQVKYSLLDRKIETDVLPYCQREKILVMAYTPLEKGRLAKLSKLKEIGKKYGKTAAQVALNWLICHDWVMAIPKAIRVEHIEENAGAMGWRLSDKDFEELNKIFPLL